MIKAVKDLEKRLFDSSKTNAKLIGQITELKEQLDAQRVFNLKFAE